MVEFTKHLFGFCGEGHPSLLYLLGIPTVLLLIRNYISKTYKLFMIVVKNCLKRLY